MYGRGTVCGAAAGVLATAAMAVAPCEAAAFPLLRLYLNGDAGDVGSGGGEAFRDLELEGELLERPAGLARADRGRIALSFESQEILSIKAESWSGTRADDRQLRLTAVAPAGEVLEDVRLVALAGVRRETAFTHLQNERAGPILHFEEARHVATLGAAGTLPFGLSFGATLESSPTGLPGYVIEGRYRPAKLVSFWALRRAVAYQYRLAVPSQVAASVRTPDLLYEIDQVRRETEIGGELGRPDVAWIRGGAGLEAPNAHWGEVGFRPVRWLAVRGGADVSVFRFDDFMRAEGTGAIAAVDLGLKRTRWFGGAEVDLPRSGKLLARYIHGDIESAQNADDIGTAATRAFLDLDLDLGLLFKSGYRLESHQVTAGWQHRLGDDLGVSLGVQGLRLVSHPVEATLSSDLLEDQLAAETIAPVMVDLVAATGSVAYDVGAFTVTAAVGQYVPVAVRQQEDPAPPKPPPGPPGPPGPKIPEDRPGPLDPYTQLARSITSALDRYGGGSLVVLEVSTRF